jgi:hypothetical protein
MKRIVGKVNMRKIFRVVAGKEYSCIERIVIATSAEEAIAIAGRHVDEEYWVEPIATELHFTQDGCGVEEFYIGE